MSEDFETRDEGCCARRIGAMLPLVPMSEDRFSAALESFVTECVRSVVALEALLLLRATRPRPWSAAALSAELRIDSHFAEDQLAELARVGLVQPFSGEATYRYAPEPAERDALVEQLEIAYAERRVSVVTLIYAAPSDRARAFADAFRIRREREDG
jgi:hypothetical protein